MMESAEDTADTALNEALSMLDSLTTDGAGFAIDSDDDDENFNIDDELDQLQLEGVDLADDKMKQDNNLASNNNIDNGGGPLPLTPLMCHPLQDNMNIDISCVDPLTLTGQSQPSESSRAPPHGHGHGPPNTFTTNVNNLTVTNNNVVTMSTTTTADISLNANANHSQSDVNTAASSNNHRSSSWTSSFASFAKVASQSIQSAVESAEATLVHQGQGEPLPYNLNQGQLNNQKSARAAAAG